MWETVDAATELGKYPPDCPVVVVVESQDYPGCAEFVCADDDRDAFYALYGDWVSRLLILNELTYLPDFIEHLCTEGWVVLCDHSAKSLLEDLDRWDQPLAIDGFTLTDALGRPSKLHGFQRRGLNKALERAESAHKSHRYHFFNWSPGCGKSALSAAGAMELVNRGQIDLVLAFTRMKAKHDLARYFSDKTRLRAVVNDGARATRIRRYESGDWDVFVLNYERAKFDYQTLCSLIRTRRVLFVLDEVQMVLTEENKNEARKHLEQLMQVPVATTVWPLTATAVGVTPLRYRDVFSLDGTATSSSNPLGSRAKFIDRYATDVVRREYLTKRGGMFPVTHYTWDDDLLHEVRHRVAGRVQCVRKTDAAVAGDFPGVQTIVLPVQMSSEDRRLYDALLESARQAWQRGESLAAHYRLLRVICTNPAALHHSSSELARELVAEHPDLCVSRHSAKLEVLGDQLEAIQGAGDKVIVFSSWTNLGIHQLDDYLAERKIGYVKHWGVGQSARESDAAVQRFKCDPSITAFVSSDAGSTSLSFQEARYVIHLEPVYDWDLFRQRTDRIDRADSYLDGLTNYVLVTDSSVETRVWQQCNARRETSAAVQGTNEVFSSRGEEPQTPEEYFSVLFG